MARDLRAINKAIVSIHPVVPNIYTLLIQVLYDVRWFSCRILAYYLGDPG